MISPFPHEGQMFQCPHCIHKATQKGHLQRHIQSAHVGQKFPCPYCEYNATIKSNLQRHMKTYEIVHIGRSEVPMPSLPTQSNSEKSYSDTHKISP